MKLLIFLLLAALAVKTRAEPKPNPSRVFRYQVGDEDRSYKNSKILNTKSDASSGRLFFKKFFGQNRNPPIIITDTNNDYTTNIDTPTSTALNTPTATTTILDPITTNTDLAEPTPITNTPADPVNPTNPVDPANPDSPTDPTFPIRRFQLYDSNDEVKGTVVEAVPNDEQNLPYALSASNAKGNRAPARIKLRLRGDKSDQFITIRLPAKYRGQRVVLQGNKGSRRPGKRRVIRRRRNRRRNNKSKKNKRRRFIAV